MQKGIIQEQSNTLSRHWGTIVYPESAPSDWLETLKSFHLDGFVSPCHDRDLLEDGEFKKEHYHVMVSFPGKKSRKQIIELFSSFGGVGAECVQNPRSYARYLCHLDETSVSKALYDTKDVVCLGSSDYSEYAISKKDGVNAVREMIAWVRLFDCTSFCDLMDYAANENEVWFNSLLESSSPIMIAYIKSYTWKRGLVNAD